MFSAFETFVALRYLRSKRKEVFISIITVLSVLGVAVSVMVLDIVMSIMTGLENELQEKLIDASSHITVNRFAANVEKGEELIPRILEIPGVKAAQPYTYSQAMISVSGGARGVLIRGIVDSPSTREKFAEMGVEGEGFEALFSPAVLEVARPDGIIDEVKLPPILVGKTLQQTLGLIPGTAVTLMAPRFSGSPQGLIPRLRRFVVVGVYHSGLSEYERGLAYISLDDAREFFEFGDSVTGIEVTVKDVFRANEIASLIEQKLFETGMAYDATSWTKQHKALFEMMALEKRAYFIVLLLLVLIASFSIISTLVMVVMEKGRDIAVLKSIGASDKSVCRIFMLQGSIIGVLGVVFGTLLGYLGGLALRAYGFPIDETVFAMKELPVHMEPGNFALVAVAAFLITVLAGIYPAVRASRLRPAEVFRYE